VTDRVEIEPGRRHGRQRGVEKLPACRQPEAPFTFRCPRAREANQHARWSREQSRSSRHAYAKAQAAFAARQPHGSINKPPPHRQVKSSVRKYGSAAVCLIPQGGEAEKAAEGWREP